MPKRRKSKKRRHSNRLDYNSTAYKTWRKSVFERDNYTCQYPKCKRRGYVQAHHIKRWADYPLLRYDLKNGITLCRRCHRKVDKKEEFYERLFYMLLLFKSLKK
jgi:5-methylcytosine-specific restriction endonuclease McrA